MAGIYVHIPFCKQACHYCDFHFSTNQELRADVVESILKEIDLQKNYLGGEQIQTIYFGGGTPSILNSKELAAIMHRIKAFHSIAEKPEITVEANPDDLTRSKLDELLETGVNRLSIGIQSFHPKILSFLNRSHDAKTAITSYQLAKEAGFNNISIDLIYAIPNESNKEWEEDVEQAIGLQPEHISCYSLTIEEKTVFGKWSAAGKLKSTDDEVAAAHLEMLMDKLERNGYEHYEISNFSKPGLHARHNSNYWNQEKYLGLGPSAHSYNGTNRQFNVSNNSKYISSLKSDFIPFESEMLSRENKINEFILTSLRTQQGTDLKKLHRLYGFDLLNSNGEYLSTIFNSGLAILEADVLRLTRKGKLLADKISSDLFVEP